MMINEKNSKIKTKSNIKKICKLLELTQDEYETQIGDFYTSLTTDKRFILLENACWDLKDRHKVEINLNEDDDLEDDDEEIEDIEEDDSVETVSSEHIDSMEDEEGREQEDELEDLTILNEDEMEDE